MIRDQQPWSFPLGVGGPFEEELGSAEIRTTRQNPSGGRCGKRPIESSRETAGRNDPSGGRRGRTGRFSGDHVPPLDEFSRRPVGAGLATGPASESRRPGHASGWGDCRRCHRLGEHKNLRKEIRSKEMTSAKQSWTIHHSLAENKCFPPSHGTPSDSPSPRQLPQAAYLPGFYAFHETRAPPRRKNCARIPSKSIR